MSASRQAILDLVERFARNVDLDRSPGHNEARLRSGREMVSVA